MYMQAKKKPRVSQWNARIHSKSDAAIYFIMNGTSREFVTVVEGELERGKEVPIIYNHRRMSVADTDSWGADPFSTSQDEKSDMRWRELLNATTIKMTMRYGKKEQQYTFTRSPRFCNIIGTIRIPEAETFELWFRCEKDKYCKWDSNFSKNYQFTTSGARKSCEMRIQTNAPRVAEPTVQYKTKDLVLRSRRSTHYSQTDASVYFTKLGRFQYGILERGKIVPLVYSQNRLPGNKNIAMHIKWDRGEVKRILTRSPYDPIIATSFIVPDATTFTISFASCCSEDKDTENCDGHKFYTQE